MARIIGQQEGKKLTQKQFGILAVCLNAIPKQTGYIVPAEDWAFSEKDFEGLVSEQLVTVKEGPNVGERRLDLTEKGKNALKNRPKRIVYPSS
jgi:hypothetical protein